MAFCNNCGKSLEEAARFCTNCGTPVPISPAPAVVLSPNAGVALAPATASATEPSAPVKEIREAAPELDQRNLPPPAEVPLSTTYPDFSTSPQASTSPTFIIVCVVLLLLIVGGVAGTIYLQRQGKTKAVAAQQTPAESSPLPETNSPATSTPQQVSSVASSTSAGSGSTSTASAPPPVAPVADSVRAMNLGNYPGANPVAIATLTGETVVAGFLTRDTPQQVMQFYKIRFPSSTTNEIEGKAELFATLPGGERIRIQAQPQGSNTQVMVLQER